MQVSKGKLVKLNIKLSFSYSAQFATPFPIIDHIRKARLGLLNTASGREPHGPVNGRYPDWAILVVVDKRGRSLRHLNENDNPMTESKIQKMRDTKEFTGRTVIAILKVINADPSTIHTDDGLGPPIGLAPIQENVDEGIEESEGVSEDNGDTGEDENAEDNLDYEEDLANPQPGTSNRRRKK